MLQLTHAMAAAMNPSSPPTPVRPRISALHSPSDSQMATYAAFLAHSKKSTDRGFFRTFIAGKRTVERSAAPQQPMRARWNRKWGRTEKVDDILKVGAKIQAKCVEYDAAEGKTRLSLKQMTPPPAGWVAPPPRPPRLRPKSPKRTRSCTTFPTVRGWGRSFGSQPPTTMVNHSLTDRVL